ncbi:hypothetical protein, partial [Mesorhizobium sp.]|uniref:hypothetical protein n=1 Tax=Mesorhizobium sp. TaxID=1871066 RepID=UPI0025804361
QIAQILAIKMQQVAGAEIEIMLAPADVAERSGDDDERVQRRSAEQTMCRVLCKCERPKGNAIAVSISQRCT